MKNLELTSEQKKLQARFLENRVYDHFDDARAAVWDCSTVESAKQAGAESIGVLKFARWSGFITVDQFDAWKKAIDDEILMAVVSIEKGESNENF